MTKRDNDNANLIMAFTCGGLLGAGIALLLAPRSGRETRRSLTHLGEITQKRTMDFGSDLSRKMDHIFSDIRDDLKSRVNDGKSWTEEKMSGIEDALRTGKRRIVKEMDQILHA